MYDITDLDPCCLSPAAQELLKALVDARKQMAVILEKVEEAFKELGSMAADYFRSKAWEVELQAQFRAHSSSQAAARAKAYALQMTHEKARQVMRRRKMLHT